MGVDIELAQGAIRVSLGVDSNSTQVEEFIAALKTEVDRLKQLTAMAA
jgi:cysteine desulfurase